MNNIIAFRLPEKPAEKPAPLSLCIGRRIHCILYGGRDGIVVQIDGIPSPASVRPLMGGVVMAGGRATIHVAFPDCDYPHISDVPEAIIYGPQWRILDGIADPVEVDAAQRKVAATVRNAKAERERRERETAEAKERGNVFLVGRVPAWAKYAIVGELQHNDSDSMTDYYSSHTIRTLLLGWSKTGRANFREMRLAAAVAEETAHLGPDCNEYRVRLRYDHDSSDPEGVARCWLKPGESFHYHRGEWCPHSLWDDMVPPFPRDDAHGPVPFFLRKVEAEAYVATLPAMGGCTWEISEESVENRENYSMGHGMYLAKYRHSGWQVRKVCINDEIAIAVGRGGYRIPEPTPKATRFQPTAPPKTEGQKAREQLRRL